MLQCQTQFNSTFNVRKKKKEKKQILFDTINNKSLFAIRYKQEKRDKLCIIMQILTNVRYLGVLGKCKAKKSRDFSKLFKSSANTVVCLQLGKQSRMNCIRFLINP